MLKSLPFVALAVMVQWGAAGAATIVVDGGVCQLADAIAAANTDAAAGGCPAGAGADVIDLRVDVVLDSTYAVDAELGPVGLPVITTPLTIQGNGHTIARDPAAPLFRLLAIKGGPFFGPDASLDLHEVTLTGGNVNAVGTNFNSLLNTVPVTGGALASLYAPVTISDSVLAGNQADTGGALIALGGTLDIFNTELSNNVAEQSGGAVYTEFAKVTLRRSRLDDNVAGRAGGAVAAANPLTDGYNVDIVDSAFHRNTSRSGGALALLGSSSQGRATNSLFQDNFVSDPGTSTIAVFAPGGGAISVFNASDLEMRNSLIVGNEASADPQARGGGATVAGSGASIKMIDSEVTNNTTDNGILGVGGGIAVGPGGFLAMRGSTVARNDASWDGGGIDANQGLVQMAASRVAENDSGADGGGLRVFQQDADIIASRITDNRAVRQGGGVQFSDGTSFTRTLTLRDSTVARNGYRSDLGANRLEGAGLHFESFVDATIDRSTIADNVGQGSVGLVSAGTAIFANSSAMVKVVNSTIAGNDGLDSGGGTIFSSNAATVNLSHVTVVGNSQSRGGGIRNLNGVTIGSTILADNLSTADAFYNCAEFFPPIDNGGNFADDASCGGGVAVENDTALALQPLAENGGATKTIALGAGGVLIDSGSECPEVGNLDQRGAPRDSNCDAGAYEAGLVLPLIGFETTSLNVYEGLEGGFDVAITVDKRLSNLPSGTIEIWPTMRGSAAPGWDYLPNDDTAPIVVDLSGPDQVVTHLLHFTLLDDQEAEGDESVLVDFVFAGPAVRNGSVAHNVTIIDDDTVLPNQCAALQAALQDEMGDEDPARYRNHGKYVSPVARATSRAVSRGEITPECQGCIVSQFARSIPIAEQTVCEGSSMLITQ